MIPGFESSLRRHEAPAQYRLGQKLGLESRSRLLGGSPHFRDAGHPIRQPRLYVYPVGVFLMLMSILQTRRSSRRRSKMPESTTRTWPAALQPLPLLLTRTNLKRLRNPKTRVRVKRMRPHLARRIRLLGQVRKRRKNETRWSCSLHDFLHTIMQPVSVPQGLGYEELYPSTT
jgi:hypothetical protein